jgi:hypothetical protein
MADVGLRSGETQRGVIQIRNAKMRWLHLTFMPMALVPVTLGFASCASLDSSSDTASAVSESSTPQVWFHGVTEQAGLHRTNGQSRSNLSQDTGGTSLPRDLNPDWGPVPW